VTSCAKALQLWAEKNDGKDANGEEHVSLIGMIPPIQKMDSALNNLAACKKLSLSTNSIDKMISLPGLKNLEILSLGRNQIKKIQGLEEVGGTLRELWISYNHIATLDGLHPCVKLQILFMSNNKVKAFDEINKLSVLPELCNVLFLGNPMYDGLSKKQAAPEVLKRLPGLKTLDGEMCLGHEEDEVMTGVRDKLNDRFQGVENALDTLGLDIAAPLNLQQFVEHFAKLDVTKDEAEHIFDVVDDANGKTGTITLEHVADTFANL